MILHPSGIVASREDRHQDTAILSAESLAGSIHTRWIIQDRHKGGVVLRNRDPWSLWAGGTERDAGGTMGQ